MWPRQLEMRHRYIGLWLVVGVLLVLALWPYAMRNVAYGAINVALGNRPSSAEQRAALLMLTQAVFSDRPDAASDFSAELPGDEVHAKTFVTAERYLYRGDLNAAASRFALLAADELPALQQTVGGAWVLMLDDVGRIVLDAFTGEHVWVADESANATNLTFTTGNGVGTVRYTNTLQQRDLAGFTLDTGVVPLRYHDALAVRFKSGPQSTLTVEAMIDGRLQRLIAYRENSGEWETVVVPLDGTYLESIRILAHEPGRSPSAETHAIWLNWIALEPAAADAGD